MQVINPELIQFKHYKKLRYRKKERQTEFYVNHLFSLYGNLLYILIFFLYLSLKQYFIEVYILKKNLFTSRIPKEFMEYILFMFFLFFIVSIYNVIVNLIKIKKYGSKTVHYIISNEGVKISINMENKFLLIKWDDIKNIVVAPQYNYFLGKYSYQLAFFYIYKKQPYKNVFEKKTLTLLEQVSSIFIKKKKKNIL